MRVCFLIAGFLLVQASGSCTSGGELFDARLAERPHCKTFLEMLTPAGRKVWDSASSLADDLGRMPTLDEYAQLHLNPPDPLAVQDTLSLFYCFGTIQKASLSNAQLATLFEARRDNISAIRATWTTSKQGAPASSPDNDVKDCATVISTNGLLLRVEMPTRAESHTRTYTDGVYRDYFTTAKGSRYGTVENKGSIEKIYPLDSPLVVMGVVSWQKEVGSTLREPLDVRTAIMDGFTYESPVEFDGLKCLAGGSIENRYYFSLEHDYALKGAQLSRLTFDATRGAYRESDEIVTLTFRDFHNVSPNIYVPFSQVREFRNEEGKQQIITQVSECTVNDAVEKSTFTDIFPDGAVVSDSLQNATYVVGQDAAQSSDLPVKPRGVSRNLLLTVNGVFAVLALMLWLKRRRSIRNAE